MGEIGNVAKSGTVLSAGGTAARRRAPDQICRRPALFGNRVPPYLPGLERGDKSDRVRFCPEIYRNGHFETKRVRLAFVAWPLAGPSGSSATRLPFELRSSAHARLFSAKRRPLCEPLARVNAPKKAQLSKGRREARRDSPAPKASGCPRAKPEPRSGRKGSSRPQGPARQIEANAILRIAKRSA